MNNLVYNLGSIQNHYVFDLCRTPLPLVPEPDDDGRYDDDQLAEAVIGDTRKMYPGEYPVLVCGVPLREDLTASFDSTCGVLSTASWNARYPGQPYAKVAAFQLIDMLLTRVVDTPVHETDLRACPADSCDTPEESLAAMERADFCHDCRLALRRAVNTGRLSNRELAAVYRMLDWVAGRNRAFVIMPFGEGFDLIYENHIRTAIKRAGWDPVRVDERADAAEITNLIREETLRARAVVADLTGRNPNVYYELGFAHAIETPTVLLIQNISDAPFDIRQWRLIPYQTEALGLLQEKIGKALSELG